MPESPRILEVDLGQSSIPRPTEENIARRGPRRLVKLVPLPGSAGPAIWTSPHAEFQLIDGKQVSCRTCIVLVSAEPPLVTRVYVPADFYERLEDVPVAW
jgi:hypothetical protein